MSGRAPPGEIVSVEATAPAVWLTSVSSLFAAESHLLDKSDAILVRNGAALRPPGGRARRRAARRSARRPHAAAHARGVRRPGASPRGGVGAARRARVGPTALHGALRTPG